MKIEIDQSGHVEYTSVKTVVGDSLGNTILIKAKDKRVVQEIYRLANKPRMFTIEIFSILVTFLIKLTIKPASDYFIDVEYPGKESEITSLILKFSKRLGFEITSNQINFKLVGKKSKSHEFAHHRYTGEIEGKTIKINEVLRLTLP